MGMSAAGTLTSQTREALTRCLAEDPAPSILIALSGGMDSVVLLDVLRSLAGEMGLTLAAAHLNHGMRPEAEKDAAFVAGLCRTWGIPCRVGYRDVPALAREAGASPEEAARRARYDFLEEARQAMGCRWIALAHHRRDQAETMLLRLGRGTSGQGLGGMRPRQGRLIRPFLDIPWEALRDYAAECGLSWREDATNADCSIPRNALRHRVLPALEAVFPAAQAHMAQAARLLRQDEDCLHTMAEDLAAPLGRRADGRWMLDLEKLASAHPALQGRAILLALRQAGCTEKLGTSHVEAAQALLTAQTGAAIDLPGGWRLWKERRVLALGRAGEAPAPLPPTPFPKGGGVLRLAGWEIQVAPGSFADGGQPLDAERIPEDAVLRRRQPGDWMQPLGMAGRRKVKDILIDDHVPRSQRENLLFLAAGSRVLHILGTQRIDESVKVSDSTRESIVLWTKNIEVES